MVTQAEPIDKFKHFDLTALAATKVKAPLIKKCYANFECTIFDTSMLSKYNFFIFKVVKAHVATSSKYPRKIHYRGDGLFMVSGEHVNRKKLLKPENL